MATSTTITFTGLFVLRRDPGTDEYDVGILRARDAHQPHILKIEITPEPSSGEDPWEIPSDDLEEFIQNRHTRWQLYLRGDSPAGIHAMPRKPDNRHNAATADRRDLGWIINMENDEFHIGRLPREPRALQPIIRLKHGTLVTSCKTDSVDKIRGGQTEHLGFIAGAIGLEIDTSGGQEPVLSFVNQQGDEIEIFRLEKTNRVSYQVSISNTPDEGTTIVGDHFHMYYDRLFKGVPRHERFTIKVHLGPDQKPIQPPAGDICPEVEELTPNPFRCGGILVEEGDPLE